MYVHAAGIDVMWAGHVRQFEPGGPVFDRKPLAPLLKEDDINPHQVFDGEWGGWSDPLWFGQQKGWHPEDVLERALFTDRVYRWVRVWEFSTGRWRNLTAAEISALPPADNP